MRTAKRATAVVNVPTDHAKVATAAVRLDVIQVAIRAEMTAVAPTLPHLTMEPPPLLPLRRQQRQPQRRSQLPLVQHRLAQQQLLWDRLVRLLSPAKFTNLQ